MQTLTVKLLAKPAQLADACRMQSRRDDPRHPCCPFPAARCPINMSGHCYNVQAEHWEEVLNWEENEEEEDDGQEV